MPSLFKSRTRFIGHILFLSGIFFTLPIRAQTDIDVDKIVNDVMKEATRGLATSSSISSESFKRLYGRATTKVNKTLELKLARGTLKGIAANDPIETEASGGSWRLLLTGWRNEGGDDVFIQRAPAIVMNYGNRFRYIFLSQDIPAPAYDRVNEKLEKLHKDIIKEYKDMQVEIGRNDNQMVINAVYGYNDDTGDIEERLVYLMNTSREMIMKILEESPKAVKDARKKLGEQTLTYLNKDDFVFLIDDGYEELGEVDNPAKEGEWDFSNSATKATYRTINFGDRLVFSMYEQMPDWTSDEQRDDIVARVDALVKKKPVKGAGSTEVLRYPGQENHVWVKADFALDGQIKGKDVAEYYTEFKREYAKEFHKKIQDVFKDVEKEVERAQKDFENSPVTFLNQNQYMQLADDNLEGDLDPAEGVEQGHWAFTVGEEKRDCEIFNYGDRIVYTLAMKMPTGDADVWAEVENKVRALVNDKPADKSSGMEVTRYPGYDHYVWIKASYTLDGSLKAKEINKQYRHFVYDYSKKLYENLSDLFKDYR